METGEPGTRDGAGQMGRCWSEGPDLRSTLRAFWGLRPGWGLQLTVLGAPWLSSGQDLGYPSRGPGSISGQGTKILEAVGQKKTQTKKPRKQHCIVFVPEICQGRSAHRGPRGGGRVESATVQATPQRTCDSVAA